VNQEKVGVVSISEWGRKSTTEVGGITKKRKKKERGQRKGQKAANATGWGTIGGDRIAHIEGRNSWIQVDRGTKDAGRSLLSKKTKLGRKGGRVNLVKEGFSELRPEKRCRKKVQKVRR